MVLISADKYDFRDPFQLLQYKTDIKIESTKKLIDFIHTQFQVFSEAISSECLKCWDLEKAESFFQGMAMQNELELAQNMHRPKICESLFITSYSIVEIYMNDLCERYAESRSLRIRYKDLAGQGIERASTYLDKIIDKGSFKSTQLWNQVRVLGKLRNAFIHNEGFPIDDKSKNEFIKMFDIYINENGSMQLEFDDCEKFINIIDSFIKDLYKL